MSRLAMRQPVRLLAGAASSRLDTAVEMLLITLLAFMPLAFGAVQAWSELVVVGLAGAMACCLVTRLLVRRDIPLVRTWAYVPMAGFLLLAVGQLLPLPVGVVQAVSPQTAAMKGSLLNDLPGATHILSCMTLSFYPQATRHDLRLVLAVAVVFIVVVNVYRRPKQIKRLLGAISLIGGTMALLALAQDLSGTDRIYWLIPVGHQQANGGTFVNHSHYGQYMSLSIGAALGLLFALFQEAFGDRPVTLPAVVQHLAERNLRCLWYLAGMIVLGTASVFVSLTRGGMVSMLIAAGFTALVVTSRRSLQGRAWIMSLLALAAFICVLYVGFEAVYARLATLQGLHEYGGRWQIVKDIAVGWTKFPLAGVGLGTHEVVYPMFDRSTVPALASHAENEYAQAIEETGLMGLAMLVLFAGIAWRGYARSVRHVRWPIRSAAFGLGFGLLAVMLHSFSDFGQHLPANACLSAVVCGLLIVLSRQGPPQESVSPAARPARQPIAAALALMAVTAIWAWSLAGATKSFWAESYWSSALQAEERLQQIGWAGTNEDYAELLTSAQQAVAFEPEDVKYRYWLSAYRWYSISRVTDPDTGQLVMTEQTREFARRIVEDLHQARSLCPTFGASYCLAGQIERFVLDRPEGASHIQTGYALAPCDPMACYTAGLLDALEGRADESLPKFTRALDLDGSLLAEVIDVYLRHVNRPDLAVAIAGDKIGWLTEVANRLSQQPDQHDLAAKVSDQVTKLLEAKCRQPDAPAAVLASMASLCVRQQQPDAAVEYYRRALALDYGQVGWRLSRAQLLANKGQYADAIHEARVCLRLRPQMDQAKRLIETWSVQPGAR